MRIKVEERLELLVNVAENEKDVSERVKKVSRDVKEYSVCVK